MNFGDSSKEAGDTLVIIGDSSTSLQGFSPDLKHTPLHGSQRILYDCPEDGYTIFAYRRHTTDDFYQEICRYGNYMEVLHPNDVRNEMIKIIKGMGDEYAGVSRRDCKKKVPSVKELKALL